LTMSQPSAEPFRAYLRLWDMPPLASRRLRIF